MSLGLRVDSGGTPPGDMCTSHQELIIEWKNKVDGRFGIVLSREWVWSLEDGEEVVEGGPVRP